MFDASHVSIKFGRVDAGRQGRHPLWPAPLGAAICTLTRCISPRAQVGSKIRFRPGMFGRIFAISHGVRASRLFRPGRRSRQLSRVDRGTQEVSSASYARRRRQGSATAHRATVGVAWGSAARRTCRGTERRERVSEVLLLASYSTLI